MEWAKNQSVKNLGENGNKLQGTSSENTKLQNKALQIVLTQEQNTRNNSS